MFPDETPPKYEIFRGREHSEVSLPLSKLISNGRLDLFDEVRGRKYFQIYSKSSDLIFQCGGFVGLIPINENVAIEVAPRVNISNLDRILRIAGTPHTLLTTIDRRYGASEEAGYLVDLLADALIEAVDAIVDWGKYKDYARQVYTGHPRSGRILLKDSLRLRAKNVGLPLAVTARFERTVDNAFNACIKFALERLLFLLNKNRKSFKNSANRISRLNAAWLTFRDVELTADPTFIVYRVENQLEHAQLSPPYQRAVPLALAIIKGLGPSQRNLPPSFLLGSLIFNLADAFERYVRECLKVKIGAKVLDGNLSPPSGAKVKLFGESEHAAATGVVATPDILICALETGANLAVFDAKYKPYIGIPSRDDINQVVTYAVAYKTKLCGLIYPSNKNIGGVDRFGCVGDIQVFGISIALDAADLSQEEDRFSRDVCDLLGIVPQASK